MLARLSLAHAGRGQFRSRRSFAAGPDRQNGRVSTVAIVAIVAAIIVVALVVMYLLPRGGRRKRV